MDQTTRFMKIYLGFVIFLRLAVFILILLCKIENGKSIEKVQRDIIQIKTVLDISDIQ